MAEVADPTIINERMKVMQKQIDTLENEVKDLDKRMDKFDSFTERIEYMFENLGDEVKSLSGKFDSFIDKYETRERQRMENETAAAKAEAESGSTDMKEIALEAIKIIGIIVAAVAAGKIF